MCCAPEFVDVIPNFGPAARTAVTQNARLPQTNLSPKHISDLQKLLRQWSRFKGKRDTLELAVNRLASSIHRGRGWFWMDDRILDTAIALELMYDSDSPELSYKLRMKAGHFLADNASARVDKCKQLQKFYNARSTIVHGNKTRTKHIDPEDAAETGFGIALETLQELLAQGDFPDWDKLVMS